MVAIKLRTSDCIIHKLRKLINDHDFSKLLTSLITKADRASRCMCFFRNIKRHSNATDMSPLGTTEIFDTAKMPTCSYSIHTNSPDGPITSDYQILPHS